jgi:predicted ATPase
MQAVTPNAARGDESSLATDASDLSVYQRVFVGRANELRQLSAAFDRAIVGPGALVTIVGEPGIGKSALCERISAHATSRGGRVLIGHAYEQGSLSLPYLPFIEALRGYVLQHDAETLRAQVGSAATDVGRIVPELLSRLGLETGVQADSYTDADRYRLLQAITDFLHNISWVQPLLLVLEDLQDADRELSTS